jgi:hypothetical protein
MILSKEDFIRVSYEVKNIPFDQGDKLFALLKVHPRDGLDCEFSKWSLEVKYILNDFFEKYGTNELILNELIKIVNVIPGLTDMWLKQFANFNENDHDKPLPILPQNIGMQMLQTNFDLISDLNILFKSKHHPDLKISSDEKNKPIFKPEAIPDIFNLIKGFFDEKEHVELKRILKTGDDVKGPLLFKDNGNRLADAFKQLINGDIITACEKKELEFWIRKNFVYRSDGKIKKAMCCSLNLSPPSLS